MPSFNQHKLTPRARSANRVTVMVGDQVIAFAQTTQHSFDFGTQIYYGVGSALPQEIQQLRVSPQITLDSFALTQAGMTIVGENLNLSSILANNQFNLHVVDGDTNNPLFTYVGAVASNFSENIPANQPISDSITFLAIDVLDESGQSILNVASAFNLPSPAIASGPNGLGLSF